ncbi:hypothetical protein LAZ67_23000082, partial [Cordylochernes scorpioides]
MTQIICYKCRRHICQRALGLLLFLYEILDLLEQAGWVPDIGDLHINHKYNRLCLESIISSQTNSINRKCLPPTPVYFLADSRRFCELLSPVLLLLSLTVLQL